ncbi:energy-coupling factor ABC transporter ATP-binding protein [Loktanella sp. M215]|uniref:energy-coupling factor ABC transporter ATP-binding protein n=1 Tax=Loktanella sp. M215 TaxID=2675431 RepID=UPI001F3FC30E|nr:ABC transporter ATP-binding protein [Loktanella sp. M215]
MAVFWDCGGSKGWQMAEGWDGQEKVQIALDGVTLARDGRLILQDISLTTDARRIGILGRNGSGKTTLARLLCGLIAPDRGSLRVGGVDVARDRRAALRTVGILFQNPDHQIIFPTVTEELTFGLLQLGQDKAQAAATVARILSDFGKSHWAEAATHSLSHGQKQLVCLMAVIAMAPRVVILDEPFSGLDLVTRLQLGAYLARIEATVVHITHDPEALRDYDLAIWLDEGRIVQSGAAAAVKDAYVARMMELGAGDDLSDLAG